MSTMLKDLIYHERDKIKNHTKSTIDSFNIDSLLLNVNF